MHELSLAQNLIDQLLELAEEHQAKQIHRVLVLIGPLSGIVADSFAFGFDALKQDHSFLREACLLIEHPSPTYTCLDCRKIMTAGTREENATAPFQTPYPSNRNCQWCGSKNITATGGSELILKQIEME